MAEFNHDSIVPYSESQGAKKDQVAQMFNQIAPKYDFMNRFLSLGIDVGWRKKAIRQLDEIMPETILDVATGTADVALLSYAQLAKKPQKITGIDISEGMLAIGRKKIEEKRLTAFIELQQGDSEAINFDANTFDAITVAFGVRNYANLDKGLADMHRVLKIGGKTVILEFSKPTLPGIKNIYNFYTRLVAPKAGRFFAKDQQAYQYLNNSIQAFPEGNAFLQILQNAGFINCYKKTLTFGVCTIYCGYK